MVVYVVLDVIITICLEFNKGESDCLVEDTAMVYDCPERDSGISCKLSRPGTCKGTSRVVLSQY